MKTPKIVLDQIDKAVNPKRDLGKVKLNRPVVYNYRDKEDVSERNLSTVTWKKRYYSWDRGDYYVLDPTNFTNYFGKIYRTSITGNFGNFIDFLTTIYSNVHYSVDVYTEQTRSSSLTVRMSGGSLSLYVNQVKTYSSSEDNYYITGTHAITLTKGWNTIDLFIYNPTEGIKIEIENDLGRRISAWRAVDFEPPTVPEWHSTPLVSEYVDPRSTPELQNVLRWKNAKYNNPESDLRGWGVYRRVLETTRDENDTNVTIVSGWDVSGFTISGDKRAYFPSDMWIGSAGPPTDMRVSGTEYDSTLNQTIVTTSGSNSFSSFAGNTIGRYLYKHMFDVEWDVTLPVIISGIDNKDIKARHAYFYALDAYDDSVNKNRSEKTGVESVAAGDREAPNNQIDSNVIITNGGLKKVSISIKNPDRWAIPQLDVRGYRAWTTANPVPDYDDYLVGDFPVNVSGTNTRLEITKTVSGGSLIDLLDKTQYTFYLSCYDWYGNEDLTGLPSRTATTSVKLKTDPGSARVEVDSDTNSIKIYADLARAPS